MARGRARQSSGRARHGGAASANGDSREKLNREKFLPVTRQALVDRLTTPSLWPEGQAAEARRFFRYLDFWRHQAYVAKLLELEQTYEPFNPDSDMIVTRTFSGDERIAMQHQLIEQARTLLVHANFTELHPSEIAKLSHGSHYGLDLHLDLTIFDEVAVFYRGSSKHTLTRRDARRLYLGTRSFEIPIFQRLCVLFKLKPFAVRVAEVMAQQKCERRRAERIVIKQHRRLPPATSADCVYMKLFKNIPHTDLEMVFPNTHIRFRTADKVKFGVSASGGIGTGVVGAMTKLAAVATPFGMAGAVAAFGGIGARQVTSFIGQRNKYLMKMAQNLYFHAMADNRGVLTLLADRAAEEDVKEEILLYSVLAKQQANVRDLDEIDAAVERYLKTAFGVDANFDIDEALKRLMDDGIVTQGPDGTFDTLSPRLAAIHIDALWDAYLDHLPDTGPRPGRDVDTRAPQQGADKA